MIPSAANSDYPKFIADQVLTSDNLNDLFGYLDEQGRMTRTNLMGMGIVCGLQVKTSADGTSITITKGVGITSHGYLISVPETTYTKRTTQIFDAVKCDYYDRFVNVAAKTQKLNLWELKQEAEEINTSALTKSFLQDQNKIVLMFVELLEENNKNCSPDSCDDKGITITLNVRPLLVSKADADSFLSNGSNTGAGNAILLPEYKMRRYDVPATLLLDTEDVMQGYLDILSQPFISGYKSGITNAYNVLETLLADEIPAATFQSVMNSRFESFAFLNNGSITQAQAINLQYYYDFFSDLALAYDELRIKVHASVCACLPSEDLFPRHILLGEAVGFDEQKSGYRTRFISTPVLCCCASDRKAVIMLFRRILLLLENFIIPSEENNTNRQGIPIRITPSTLGREALSEKAIPFYYSVNKTDDPLYLSWSPDRALRHTEHQVLSYHAAQYNTEDEHVKNPLKYDLEPNNFLRIEGHIGKDYRTVVTGIDAMKKTNRLPFEMLALSSDTRGILTIINSVKSMDTTGSIAGAFTEMLKHPCCFADLFLALDNWITRLRCCLADQKRYYMAQPSFVRGENIASVAMAAKANTEANVTPKTIGEVYEIKMKEGTINNQFCSDVFVNIATEKALPGQGLIMMPYKIDRMTEILPDHISKLDAAELEKRITDLTGTATQMRTMFASPNIAGTMVGVNMAELQSRLQMNCIICLLAELKTLIREFLLRLLGLMIRQKLGFYSYKNPGISHKAGVPLGGTFILIYHEETQANTIAGASENLASRLEVNKTRVAEDPNASANVSTIRVEKFDAKAPGVSGATAATVGTSSASLSVKSGEQTLLSSALLLEEIKFLTLVKTIKENPNPVLDPIVRSLKPGVVIADFYLPYLCCSDCAPTQMVVLSGTEKENQPPIARPGDNVSIVLPTSEVELDGSKSTDPDGKINKYLWEQQSGPAPAFISNTNEAKTKVAKLVEGAYEFKLTVTDDKGAVDSAVVSVSVLAKPNVPPIAKAIARPAVVTLDGSGAANTVLDGGDSRDPDGDEILFRWSLPAGTTGAEIKDADKKATDVKFGKAGLYVFTLTVKDDKGASDSVTVTVTVNDRQNQPPVAKATANPSTVVLTPNGGASVLDGSDSKDPDGTIEGFNWVLSGGTGAVIKNPVKAKTEVQFSKPGSYEFTLTVKDDKGAQGFDKVIITVSDAPNEPPVARATAMPLVLTIPAGSTAPATLQLDGSASSDPENGALSFQWSIPSGTQGVVINSPNQAKTTAQITRPGNFVFSLVVKDNKGAADSANVSVNVNQETAPQKTCASLEEVMAGFNSLKNADAANFASFKRLYSDYTEIEAFYGRMQSANIPARNAANQIAFFTSEKIEFRLPVWIDNLRGLTQESSTVRLLCLLMLNLHTDLANYISCIQNEDVNKASVKMNDALIAVINFLRAIQQQVANYSSAQRAVLNKSKANAEAEQKRIRNNDEEAAKQRDLKILEAIFELLKLMGI